jgi:outer membrane protein
MRKALALTLFTAATALSQPVLAQEAGTVQVKVLATAVLPDGKVKSIDGGTLAATVAGLGVQTEANDNYVPTLAIEYFTSPNISIETICCTTAHHVSANAPAALDGAVLADKVLIVPATFTLKYHFGAPGGIRPYIGAGPSYFIFLKDRAGAGATSALGATNVTIDDTLGAAVQAGVDVPVNAVMSLSFDAKKYLMRPDAHFYNAGGTEVLLTHHKLDPLVLSAGVGFKF